MSKTKINDPGAHHAGSGALIRRFLPYLAKYKMTLFLDLFCAALTTLCDIVLPKIMSTITNAAMGVGITLTAGIVLRLGSTLFCAAHHRRCSQLLHVQHRSYHGRAHRDGYAPRCL